MAVKRRKSKRRADLTDDEEAWLRGASGGFVQFQEDEALKALWLENRDRIIAEHIAECPGTRPRRWWRYDAPEPLGDDETEAAYLARHGLLLESELSEALAG